MEDGDPSDDEEVSTPPPFSGPAQGDEANELNNVRKLGAIFDYFFRLFYATTASSSKLGSNRCRPKFPVGLARKTSNYSLSVFSPRSDFPVNFYPVKQTIKQKPNINLVIFSV